MAKHVNYLCGAMLLFQWDDEHQQYLPIGPGGSTEEETRQLIEKMERAPVYFDSNPHPAPTPWQPIETAPKDGTWVLLYDVCDYMVVAVWDYDGWYDLAEDTAHYHPTHWMPLPPKPKQD